MSRILKWPWTSIDDDLQDMLKLADSLSLWDCTICVERKTPHYMFIERVRKVNFNYKYTWVACGHLGKWAQSERLELSASTAEVRYYDKDENLSSRRTRGQCNDFYATCHSYQDCRDLEFP